MSLTLGTSRRGKGLRLSDEERSRHIHVIGASGTGKSKLLESLIRQDILGGRGLCLIDPHGTLADLIVEWMAALQLGRHRRVHVLDLKDPAWSAGFNPLRLGEGQEAEARVDAMVATCAEVWGGEDINQTPLLTTCLQLLFYALASNDLTLAEAIDLSASSDPLALRKRFTQDLENPVFAAYWREFAGLAKKDFEERFSSARRRLLRFLGSPAVRRVVGQRERVLDVKAIMDAGDILIVNLVPRGGVSQENARLVGALLLSELRLCALARDPVTAKRQPFTLYIDECYDFLTGDVERMLDETRKFGLHVVLAHQRLGQLRDRSEAIFNGVMAGGQTKIVFGGMTDEDAEYMAKEVYRSSFNLQRPKHVLDKPVVVDELPYWLESESSTRGESSTESTSENSSWGSTSGTSESLSQGFDMDGLERGSSASAGTSWSENSGGGYSSGSARAESSSTTQGRSQTLKAVRVTMPTAVHSLDEELHLAIVKLRELPNQAAIVKRRGHPPVRFRPSTVKPGIAWPDLTSAYVADACAASPYVSTSEDADAEINGRLNHLRSGEPHDDTNAAEPFWSE